LPHGNIDRRGDALTAARLGMHNFWSLLTRLGESQILLPAMAVGLAWLWTTGKRELAQRWLAATAVAAALTTLTKVAFLGYEIGYAPLNYTGISGHAMFAAAVWPILLLVVVPPRSPRRRAWTVGCGYALAAVLAYSRVRVGAHSPFESLIGFGLGSLASAWVLQGGADLRRRAPAWLAAALALWFAALPPAAPEAPTHDWVIRLSLALSDRPEPYRRWQMHRDWRRAFRQQMEARATASVRAALPR
jgi:hypothetical protein